MLGNLQGSVVKALSRKIIIPGTNQEKDLPTMRFKVQGSLLFVTYTIIQGIISSEMLVRTGPLNGKCKKIKIIIG